MDGLRPMCGSEFQQVISTFVAGCTLREDPNMTDGMFYYGQDFVHCAKTAGKDSVYDVSVDIDSTLLGPGHRDRAGFRVMVEKPSWEDKNFSLPNSYITGLSTIWPSEQLLTMFCLQQPAEVLRGKRILEVASGFHGLAGTMVAKYCSPKQVIVSDASAPAVQYLSRNISLNQLSHICSSVVLDVTQTDFSSENVPDIVLASDCFLFDDVRSSLIHFLDRNLPSDGLAIVSAPPRSGTLSSFLIGAAQRCGFIVAWYWHRKSSLANQRSPPHAQFNPDIHQPWLALLYRSTIPNVDLEAWDRG